MRICDLSDSDGADDFGLQAAGSRPNMPDMTTNDAQQAQPPEISADWVPEMTFPAEVRAYVEARYRAADVILEYGMGGSTAFAAALPGKTVISVENARPFYDSMMGYFAKVPPKARVVLHHQDVGRTKAWGFPADASGWPRYHDYPMSIWRHPDFVQPDLVLIDGRFRVGCFLATLFLTEKPVTVLFDDYTKRGYYHLVEQYAPRAETVGRMVRFDLKPATISRTDLFTLFEELQKPG